MAKINPTQQKLETLRSLLLDYDKGRHSAQSIPENHPRYSWHQEFQPLKPGKWNSSQTIPYVAATLLLDVYSQLPQRPDLAFGFLWSAINACYNDLYLSQCTSNGDSLQDGKSIDFSVERISQRLHHEISLDLGEGEIRQYAIRDVLRSYLNCAPQRIFNFVANYALKGIAVDRHNAVCNSSEAIRKILIPSTYNTLKSKFPAVYGLLNSNLGLKYFDICNISETPDKTDISFGIQPANSNKSRALIHEASEVLKASFVSYDHTSASAQAFTSEKEWLSAQIYLFLYAARNSAVHGNVANRLNSIFAKAETISASSWTFLFGYTYLALILYCLKSIDLDDLAPCVKNSELL